MLYNCHIIHLPGQRKFHTVSRAFVSVSKQVIRICVCIPVHNYKVTSLEKRKNDKVKITFPITHCRCTSHVHNKIPWISTTKSKNHMYQFVDNSTELIRHQYVCL